MRSISGYVLLQGTNVGIPKVVVAAYDSNQTLREILAEHKKEKGFASSLMRGLGNSISSVLTGTDGKFTIDTEDLKFEGNESRPDLILIVYAPEDIRDADNPVPLPPEERILYLSALPRHNAGAEEAYIIRLLSQQVDRFRITLASQADEYSRRKSLATGYLNDIRNSERDRTMFREEGNPALEERLKKKARQAKEIRTKAKLLSAIPANLKNNPMLLEDPDDLQKIQKKSATEGLSKLKRRANPMVVNLTSADLHALKIKPNGEKEVTATIDANAFLKKTGLITSGNDYIRKKDIRPSDITPEALYRKYASLPTDEDKDDGETTDENEIG